MLQVTIGFEEYTLQPGDAVSLDSTTPHRLANTDDTPVHAIWFVPGRDPHDAQRRHAATAAAERGSAVELRRLQP